MRGRPPVYDIRVTGTGVWEDEREREFEGLTPRQRDLADSLIRTAHDRHVGVSAHLAAGYARLLSDAIRVSHDNPWRGVLSALGEALATGVEDGLDRRSVEVDGVARLLARAPYLGVQRLVLPLCFDACRRIGRTYLFSNNAVRGVSTAEYQAHAKELAKEVHEIAGCERWRKALYEVGLALVAVPASRASGHHSLETAVVPALDRAMVLRLRPRIQDDELADFHRRRRNRREPHRRTRTRQREDGFSSIHYTSVLDEIPNMLKSIWTLPDEVRYVDLLLSRFPAHQRPPRRPPLRDVLLVGILPRIDTSLVNRALLKASWFDCAVRFLHHLQRLKLNRSEITWIEEDASGRPRIQRCSIESLPDLAGSTPEPTPRFRRQVMRQTKLLPGLLDTGLGGVRWGRGASTPPTSDHASAEERVEWVAQAWLTLLRASIGDATTMAPASSGSDRPGELPFRAIHAMAFQPTAQIEAGVTSSRLGRAMRLNKRELQTASVTGMPPTSTALKECWLDSPNGRRNKVPLSGSEDPNEQQFADALVERWMKMLSEVAIP